MLCAFLDLDQTLSGHITAFQLEQTNQISLSDALLFTNAANVFANSDTAALYYDSKTPEKLQKTKMRPSQRKITNKANFPLLV